MSRHVLLAIMLLAAILGCKKTRQTEPEADKGVSPTPSGPGTPTVPEVVKPGITTWPSDSKLAAQLDPPAQFLGYQFRPPKEYTYISQQKNVELATDTVWQVDPVAINRERRSIRVSIRTFAEATTWTLDTLMTNAASKLNYRFHDIVRQPAESGQINGVPFARVRFTAKHSIQGMKTIGVLYAAIDGKSFIQLLFKDEVPSDAMSSASLAQAEEAFLTFRRADQATKPLDLKHSSGGRIAPGRPDDIPAGNIFGTPYRGTAPAGGLLIGFDVGYVQYVRDVDAVGSLRPLYRIGDKETAGQLHGPEIKRGVRVMAKPGYAVGAIKVNSGLWIDGFSVTFMKVNGTRLDPKDQYESEWVGGKEGTRSSLGGDGTPVVGITGQLDFEKRATSVGFVYGKPDGQ